MNYDGCKQFVFQKVYRTEPLKYGGLDLYQVGEVEISKNSEVPEHAQWCCEISYVLSGDGVMYVDDVPVPIKQGDVHVISNDVKHRITSGIDRGLRYAFLGFNFNSDFPVELSDIKQLFVQNQQRAVCDDGKIGQIFSLLISENYNENLHSFTACENLMSYILILTKRLFSGSTDSKLEMQKRTGYLGQPLYGIIRYIDEVTPACPSVSSLCSMFNYSESYVSHLFKERLGQSIQSYIVDSKIRYAKRLLSEGKHGIADIANLLGYSSVQSFCKSFKKRIGVTPGEFKKKN